MSITKKKCTDFLQTSQPIIDVRSPAEFAQGHIPSAINMPLLSNEERALIGTLYKQESQEKALLEGLKITGPKFADFVSKAVKMTESEISVYCWRGGMRSSFMASLFSLANLNVSLLDGGYKSYRNFSLDQFALPYELKILGGYTGSGKTEILQQLKDHGEQMIDLEQLALHKGSAYGSVGQTSPQPTNEQFENNIALCLSKLNPKHPIWVEDESRNIGRCKIPDELFSQMRESSLFVIHIDKDLRMKRLQDEYAPDGYAHLEEPTKKLERRLGNEKMREALQYIENEDPLFFSLLLEYYDKAYDQMIVRRKDPPCTFIPSPFSIDKLLQKA